MTASLERLQSWKSLRPVHSYQALNRSTRNAQCGEVLPLDEKPGDVLTIEELSASLKIPKSTLCKLVRECKVLCEKIGRHWHFRKEFIDRWLEETHGDTKDGENE